MADLQLTRGKSLNSNNMIFTFFLLQNLWWAGIKKGGRTNKLNWGEENWTEIWFHSVIENNYVETTLATTFLSIPKLFLSNLLKFPRVPEDFKLDAESNKHRLLQQRTTAAAPFYHSCPPVNGKLPQYRTIQSPSIWESYLVPHY